MPKAWNRYPPELLKEAQKILFSWDAPIYDEVRFGEDRPSSRVDRIVKELLPRWIKGPRVLELASGTGHFGLFIKGLGYEYQGVDIAKGMVDLANSKGLNTIQGDVEDNSIYPKFLDTIVCIKSFTFFQDPIRVLGNIKKALKEDGRFIVFYYNQRYKWFPLRLYSLFKDPDNICPIAPWDYRPTRKEFKAWIEEANMRIIYTRDCVVLPYSLIPKKYWKVVDRIDSKLTHFGFLVMAICERI